MPIYKTTPLGDLGELTVGYQARQAVSPDPGGSHQLVQLRNVQEGVLDMSDADRATLDAKAVRRTLKSGDILLRSRGANFGAIPVENAPPNAVPAAPLFLLRLASAEVLPEYIVWFLNREATQAQLHSLSTGTYLRSVGLSGFRSLPIIVPPLDVQRQMMEINHLARLERELNQRRQAARDRQVASVLEEILER